MFPYYLVHSGFFACHYFCNSTNKNVHKNNLTLSPSQVQTHYIYVAHKKDVLNDLSKVEPAVKEVQQGN